MRNLFSSESSSDAKGAGGNRVPRHSSGWKELLKHLSTQESLRVLDIGPTSSTNINYITSLGHSIYMANLVEEAAKPEWIIPAEGDKPAGFDVEGFLKSNLNFSGRMYLFVSTRCCSQAALCWRSSTRHLTRRRLSIVTT